MRCFTSAPGPCADWERSSPHTPRLTSVHRVICAFASLSFRRASAMQVVPVSFLVEIVRIFDVASACVRFYFLSTNLIIKVVFLQCSRTIHPDSPL